MLQKQKEVAFSPSLLVELVGGPLESPLHHKGEVDADGRLQFGAVGEGEGDALCPGLLRDGRDEDVLRQQLQVRLQLLVGPGVEAGEDRVGEAAGAAN